MSRVEHIAEGITLYCGDCRAILPTLDKVDVVLTDPPYSEKTHSGARTGGGNEKLIDFDSVTSSDIVAVGKALLGSATRWVVMTCDWLHAAELGRAMPDEFIRAGVWIKPNGMPQYTGDRPAMGWEAVAILHPKGRKKWNGGGSHAVWTVPKVNGEHPTEKPLALVGEWVRLFTDPGETILDPFMGSGTTGVAAVRSGRKFVGIEMEPKYFEISLRRITEALTQQDLFVEKPKRIKQEAML